MYAIIRNSNNYLTYIESHSKLPNGLILRANEMIIKVDDTKNLKESFVNHNKKAQIKKVAPRPITIIDKTDWDKEKMTEDIIKVLVDLLTKENYKDIFKIHNSLKLSDVVYCCARHKPLAKKNIELWQKVLIGAGSQ